MHNNDTIYTYLSPLFRLSVCIFTTYILFYFPNDFFTYDSQLVFMIIVLLYYTSLYIIVIPRLLFLLVIGKTISHFIITLLRTFNNDVKRRGDGCHDDRSRTNFTALSCKTRRHIKHAVATADTYLYGTI